MANTSSAKKAARQMIRRTEVNKARRSGMRTEVRRVEEAIEAVMHEFSEPAIKTISSQELHNAKEMFSGRLMIALEDSRVMAEWLGKSVLYHGKAPDLAELVEKINRITLDDLQEIARRYFIPSGLNLAMIGSDVDADAIRKCLT